MKVLRVLMVTSSYPIKGSNLGPFVRNISQGLAKKGVKVGVMVFSASKGLKSYKDGGVDIYEYPYTLFLPPMMHSHKGLIPSVKNSWIAKLEVPGYAASTAYHLARISRDYDIIHAHWVVPCGLIAAMMKPIIRKPLVTTAWGAEFHLPDNLFVRRALSYSCSKSDRVVCVSKYMKKRAAAYGIKTAGMKVIPNCIDVSRFSLPRKKTGKKEKIVIGTVRRLVPEKRIQDLIFAVRRLDEKVKRKVELWIVGDGPERKVLEGLARDAGVGGITRFFGMRDHSEIPKILSEMDIYVNPSVQEGMATANIEAMAAGCVVVAVRGVGNDEVIEDGRDGFLYPPRDIDLLVEALTKATALGWDSLGISARKKAREKFDAKSVSKLYADLYSRLIS